MAPEKTIHTGAALKQVRRTQVLTDIVLVVIVTILAYMIAIILDLHYAIKVGLEWSEGSGVDQLLVAFYVFAFSICWFAIRRLRETQMLSQSLRLTSASLAHSESLYRQLFESISEGVFIMDKKRKIVRVNEACARMLGYKAPAQLRGKLATEPFVSEAVSERFFGAAVDDGGVDEMQVALKRLGGQEIEVLASATSFNDPTTGAPRVCAVMRDITAAQAAERQRDALAHMERVVRMGELATSLSHELNQPLTGILSNAQAARRFLQSGKEGDLEKVGEAVDDIISDDRRASQVIGRMRSLLKKGEATFSDLDLNETVMEVIGLCAHDLTVNAINLSVSRNDVLPLVSGDSIQIQQVILNLLMNSQQALLGISGAKSILVCTAVCNGRVVVCVEDNAGGVASGEIDQVFEPFFTTKEDGLGMGLSICRSLIEAHEGSMWAEEGQDGLKVCFSIPIIEEDD